MGSEHRRVTGETCLGGIPLGVACEVEGFSLSRVIDVVEGMVEARILYWAEGNCLRLLPHTRDGERVH